MLRRLLHICRRDFFYAGGAEVFDGIVEAGRVQDDIHCLVAFVFPQQPWMPVLRALNDQCDSVLPTPVTNS
jgi:hypothetical protein